jgi:DNA repair protein RecN (Recombination protein N)
VSTVEVLDAGARVEEIARMLGGVEITATTRMHAGEMLASGAGTGGPSGVAAREG